MASIDAVKVGAITPLTPADLPAALALSASAKWNQNEADWRQMLRLGEGFGIRLEATGGGGEVLAASVVVLPYGDAFAWISMVLVLPEFQRRGYASLLLRHAIGSAAARGMTALLDATPAGRAAYLQEGFADTWGFARYRRQAAGWMAWPDDDESAAQVQTKMQVQVQVQVQVRTRALAESDWAAIEALDAPAFGASRMPLLRSLAQRQPELARVVDGTAGLGLRGFVLGREGREATQIGPLIADDSEVARTLLRDVLDTLPGPVYVDLLDHQKSGLLPWLRQRGFRFQRPFTRMVRGLREPKAPGDPTHIVLVAGPELG